MDGEQDKIENLKKALYSQKGVSRDAHVLDLNKHNEEDVPAKWNPNDKTEEKIDYSALPKKKGSLLSKVLISTVVFFVASISLAAYMIFNGKNIVSPNKIDINIVGPSSVRAGDEAAFEVDIVNRNGTPLELADLLVEYPKGTRSAEDKTTDMPREKITIEKIAPGATAKKILKIIPFGEEGTELSIGLNLEYRIPNSTSVYNKMATHEFRVGTSPVSLTIDALDEINSNQDLSLTVTAVSNSKETLKNILLSTTIPFGFKIESATPAPLSNKIANKLIFALGDLEAEGKRTIKIKGKIIGEANQNRVFKFEIGTENSKSPGMLSSSIAVALHEINIKKPFLAADILINRKSADSFTARSGSEIDMAIEYENNLPVLLNDIEIEARLRGEMVDKRSVSAVNGFYKSSESVLSWTKFDSSDLSSLSSGEGGTLNAHFNIFKKDNSDISNLKNQSVIVDLTIKGKRLSEKGVPEEIVSTVSKTIKIVTDAELSGQIVHTVGPIENMGSIPPTVKKATEYTVVWGIANNFNNISNTKVTAVLPTYVNWTGVVSPVNEKVTFNSESREIVWDLGTIGTGSEERKAAFQISLTPDLGQIGESPILLRASTLEALDTFANVLLKDSIGEMSTAIGSDPDYDFGDDRIVE